MLNYVPRWWPSWIGNKIIYWGNKIICCGNKIIYWGNNIGNCKSNYHIISISTALYINGQNYEHYVNGKNYEYIILSISKTLITSKSSVFDRMILASKNRVRACKIWGGEKQIDVLMQGMGGTIKVKYDILAYHWTAILHIPNLLGRMTVIRYDQREKVENQNNNKKKLGERNSNNTNRVAITG